MTEAGSPDTGTPDSGSATRPRVPFRLRIRRLLWRVLPWVALFVFLLALTYLLPFNEHGRRMVLTLGGALLALGAFGAVMTEILSPERSQLRLVPITDLKARQLRAGLRVFLLVFFVSTAGRWIVEESNWNPSVDALLGIVQIVAVILLVVGVLASTGLFRWLKSRPTDSFWGLLAHFTGKIVVPLAVAAVLFLGIVRQLGYVPLAEFVSRNLILTAVQLVAAVVAYHYLRRGFSNLVQYLFRGQDEGEVDTGDVEVDPALVGVERIGTTMLRLLVTVLAILWILSTWQITPQNILALKDVPMFGGDTVTWGTFLGGAVNIVLVLIAWWLLKTILTFFVFPQADTEVGARYAILAILKYITIALVVVLLLGTFGIDTDSLSWFFGAAGVGIGFGLRDILGNFFSGLIMLLERPIRVGDVIQVGDALGTVEDIKMRGTILRTFDNMTITIPNQQMLGERVTNRTYGMRFARVTIDVGVSYASDTELVQKALLEVAQSSPDILTEPQPLVFFQDYAESALLFSLRCYTERVDGRLGVASRLRHAIFHRFRDLGIQIPFPQRDLHVKGLPPFDPKGLPPRA